jgi:hypothetical protein
MELSNDGLFRPSNASGDCRGYAVSKTADRTVWQTIRTTATAPSTGDLGFVAALLGHGFLGRFQEPLSVADGGSSVIRPVRNHDRQGNMTNQHEGRRRKRDRDRFPARKEIPWGDVSDRAGSGTGNRWAAPLSLSELSLCPRLAFEVSRNFRAAATVSSSTEAKEGALLGKRRYVSGQQTDGEINVALWIVDSLALSSLAGVDDLLLSRCVDQGMTDGNHSESSQDVAVNGIRLDDVK